MLLEIAGLASAMTLQAANELESCNEDSARYGLALSPAQAMELAQTRAYALQATGRLEFGGGTVGKLIRAFCSSPYVSACIWAETLNALTEMFYTAKSELPDDFSDDELIAYMQRAFDGRCEGSLELLEGRELYLLERNLRSGWPAEYRAPEECPLPPPMSEEDREEAILEGVLEEDLDG